MHYRNLSKDFLTVIGNAKLRTSFVICWVAQGSRPRCGPRHPILQSNIFFVCKIICINYFIAKFIKCILWYLIKLSDTFIKNGKFSFANFNSEQLWTKNLLSFLENEVFFFKKGNPISSIKLGQRLPKSFSQLHVKNSRFFLPYFLKKDDWTKAYADPRLPTLPY